jgi:hypothetical protein
MINRMPNEISVITGLVPVISVRWHRASPNRDGRHKGGHDTGLKHIAINGTQTVLAVDIAASWPLKRVAPGFAPVGVAAGF